MPLTCHELAEIHELAEAIETVSEPSVLERMHRAALERQDPEEELWSNYADALRAPEWPS